MLGDSVAPLVAPKGCQGKKKGTITYLKVHPYDIKGLSLKKNYFYQDGCDETLKKA